MGSLRFAYLSAGVVAVLLVSCGGPADQPTPTEPPRLAAVQPSASPTPPPTATPSPAPTATPTPVPPTATATHIPTATPTATPTADGYAIADRHANACPYSHTLADSHAIAYPNRHNRTATATATPTATPTPTLEEAAAAQHLPGSSHGSIAHRMQTTPKAAEAITAIWLEDADLGRLNSGGYRGSLTRIVGPESSALDHLRNIAGRDVELARRMLGYDWLADGPDSQRKQGASAPGRSGGQGPDPGEAGRGLSVVRRWYRRWRQLLVR